MCKSVPRFTSCRPPLSACMSEGFVSREPRPCADAKHRTSSCDLPNMGSGVEQFLMTATSLSVRVDSDVVEEAYLNWAKRSGRVRLPNHDMILRYIRTYYSMTMTIYYNPTAATHGAVLAARCVRTFLAWYCRGIASTVSCKLGTS